MRVLPSRTTYVKGYLYRGLYGDVAYTPDEMIWLHYPNPLEEHAGLSPIAPIRLVADMAKDAQTYNRYFFRNGAEPGFIMLTDQDMTETEVNNFYTRWASRFAGPNRSHRPAIASFIKDVKQLQSSHRDSEFLGGLRWSLEEVARVYQVPLPLLGDYSQSALSNMQVAERMFWTNCMIPEMALLEDALAHQLFPTLGYTGYTARFTNEEIEALRIDEDSRTRRQVNLVNAGILTINEVRASRNLPPVPWGNQPPPRQQPQRPEGTPNEPGDPPENSLDWMLYNHRNNNGKVNHAA